MLDVSIRTGVMNLMMNLAKDLGLSYLYITHDLAVARYTSHEIAVMYLGKIVERGETETVLSNPERLKLIFAFSYPLSISTVLGPKPQF
jgi:peptide/nickel transport system ATP-binding protein